MSEEEASAVAIFLRKLKHLTVRAGFISRENLKEILLGCRELARGVGHKRLLSIEADGGHFEDDFQYQNLLTTLFRLYVLVCDLY